MPDPDRLLRTLERALCAFDETPGRRGHVVCLEEADEVMASGDLHGNLENFRRLLHLADLATHPRRHFVLQELVHSRFRYPAGGDRSHQLLDLLAALKVQYPRQVHLLLGNHELAELNGEWIAKGDVDLRQQFRLGIETAYGERGEEIYGAYRDLLARVPVMLRTSNRVVLCHSLPSARRMPDFQPTALEMEAFERKDLSPGGAVHMLVWGRDASRTNAEAFLTMCGAELLITGHIPCDHGFAAPNERQLILDASGPEAGHCLFPAVGALTHAALVACARTLPRPPGEGHP
jgi:hypothetical protein